MRVIVTGSRGWKNEEVIRSALLDFKREAEFAGGTLVVVHGHAPNGADRIADRLCTELRIEKIRVPVLPNDWRRYRAGAGPRRNAKMLAEFGPIDYTLAFRATGKSNGTDDMIEKSKRARVQVYLYREDSTIGIAVPA